MTLLRIWLALFLSLFCLVSPVYASAPSCDRAITTVTDGARWLIAGQDPGGMFTYEFYPLRKAEPTGANNIVRQIGSFWALVRSVSLEDTPQKRQAIDLFRRMIINHIVIGKSPAGPIAYIEEQGVGKVNSVALYLLALAELKNQGFDLTADESEKLPLLVNGLKQMRDSQTGGFYYLYYVPREINRITSYGSSEALFGLASLVKAGLGDESLLEFVKESYALFYGTYLKDLDTFDNTLLRGFFSWAFHVQPLLEEDPALAYDARTRHLLSLALAYRQTNPYCRDKGCIQSDTISDKPFLEGIMAILPLALKYETDDAIVQQIVDYSEKALNRIIDLQVTADDQDLLLRSPHPQSLILGGFCLDDACEFMRNDLSQHAMIAMNMYIEQACRHDT